jgi:hypothetical protein
VKNNNGLIKSLYLSLLEHMQEMKFLSFRALDGVTYPHVAHCLNPQQCLVSKQSGKVI